MRTNVSARTKKAKMSKPNLNPNKKTQDKLRDFNAVNRLLDDGLLRSHLECPEMPHPGHPAGHSMYTVVPKCHSLVVTSLSAGIVFLLCHDGGISMRRSRSGRPLPKD